MCSSIVSFPFSYNQQIPPTSRLHQPQIIAVASPPPKQPHLSQQQQQQQQPHLGQQQQPHLSQQQQPIGIISKFRYSDHSRSNVL